jgi:SAM-dependent methyltransferase
MDNFAMRGDDLRDALNEIAKINYFLGGNKLTLEGVKKLLLNSNPDTEITIVDLGCGNGDMLRMLSNYGVKNHLKLKLIGIDANIFTINYAKELSVVYPNITFHCQDIFDNPFATIECDIVLLTLTLHHFKDVEILDLLKTCHTNAKIGIVVNDLHRSNIAYRLFQAIGLIFRLNRMSREDGLTSILRGFKKEELIPLSEKLNFKNYKIKWKWAFRYQWIISKI